MGGVVARGEPGLRHRATPAEARSDRGACDPERLGGFRLCERDPAGGLRGLRRGRLGRGGLRVLRLAGHLWPPSRVARVSVGRYCPVPARLLSGGIGAIARACDPVCRRGVRRAVVGGCSCPPVPRPGAVLLAGPVVCASRAVPGWIAGVPLAGSCFPRSSLRAAIREIAGLEGGAGRDVGGIPRGCAHGRGYRVMDAGTSARPQAPPMPEGHAAIRCRMRMRYASARRARANHAHIPARRTDRHKYASIRSVGMHADHDPRPPRPMPAYRGRRMRGDTARYDGRLGCELGGAGAGGGHIPIKPGAAPREPGPPSEAKNISLSWVYPFNLGTFSAMLRC